MVRRSDYAMPGGGNALTQSGDELLGDGTAFPLERVGSKEVARFDPAITGALANNQSRYDGAEQIAIYRNFLEWLFRTFRTDEASFRTELTKRLTVPAGARILVTGCGTGDDIAAVLTAFPDPAIRIWAQDVSPHMVAHAAARFVGEDRVTSLSVSDACTLPHPDGFFDVAYHFGGINLMPDIRTAIAEMTRAVRDGGQVLFGDEGVAPWLRGGDYAAMMIANIANWSRQAPLALLPANADRVRATWVLGNCFYVIDFVRNDAFPDVDIDVPHLGRRGGSIRSRYLGALEGVDPEIRDLAARSAAKGGISVSAWLSDAIRRAAG